MIKYGSHREFLSKQHYGWSGITPRDLYDSTNHNYASFEHEFLIPTKFGSHLRHCYGRLISGWPLMRSLRKVHEMPQVFHLPHAYTLTYRFLNVYYLDCLLLSLVPNKVSISKASFNHVLQSWSVVLIFLWYTLTCFEINWNSVIRCKKVFYSIVVFNDR